MDIELQLDNHQRTDTKSPNDDYASPTWTSGAIEFLRNGPLNILLIFTPIALICWAVHANDIATFIFALLAIMPLAERLGFVTEQVALHTNTVIGGLLNATFGNATELIVSIIALTKNYYRLVQLSLLGSVLSNMLLVLGTALWVGGLKNGTQSFRKLTGQINSTVLMLGVMAVLFPAVMSSAGQINESGQLMFSRVVSIFLVVIYSIYIYMELTMTQTDEDVTPPSTAPVFSPLRADPNDNTALTLGASSPRLGLPKDFKAVFTIDDPIEVEGYGSPSHQHEALCSQKRKSNPSSEDRQQLCEESLEQGQSQRFGQGLGLASKTLEEAKNAEIGGDENDDDEEEEKDLLGFYGALVWLAVVTGLIALLSEALVGTIEKASEQAGINSVFVSTIILPIIGNACEHASAIQFAYKNKMNIAVSIAVGSSTQITVFVIPLLVLIAWCSNQPLDLNFHPFESVTLFLTVIIVAVAIQGGQSNWMIGVILTFAYLIICVGFYAHNDDHL